MFDPPFYAETLKVKDPFVDWLTQRLSNVKVQPRMDANKREYLDEHLIRVYSRFKNSSPISIPLAS